MSYVFTGSLWRLYCGNQEQMQGEQLESYWKDSSERIMVWIWVGELRCQDEVLFWIHSISRAI
jgi:hypothetical protein